MRTFEGMPAEYSSVEPLNHLISACSHLISWMCLSWTTPTSWLPWRKPKDAQKAAAVPANLRTSRRETVSFSFVLPMASC